MCVLVVVALRRGRAAATPRTCASPTTRPSSSQILWSDGTLLTTLHGVEDRDPVTLGAMAHDAAAGRRRDRGRALLRPRRRRRPRRSCGRSPATSRRAGLAEGGSTITQQYVRAVMLGTEKRPQAQAARGRDGDAARAALLEEDDPRALPQHHLLRQRRLRRAGRGPDVLRQGRAATSTSRRAALLAGLIRAPERLQPVRRTPTRALARRNEVLDQMHAAPPRSATPRTALAQGAAARRGPARRPTTATPRRTSSRR